MHPETRLYRDPGSKILKTARPDILLLLPMEGAVEFWGTRRPHRTAPVGLPVLAPSHFRIDSAGVADDPLLYTCRAIPSARLGSTAHVLPTVVVAATLLKKSSSMRISFACMTDRRRKVSPGNLYPAQPETVHARLDARSYRHGMRPRIVGYTDICTLAWPSTWPPPSCTMHSTPPGCRCIVAA